MKLNIGSGNTVLEGYTPWDIKDGKQAFPLDLPDNSVDAIYASHILEHFGHRETVTVVQDWVRVLKPGGLLQICVPDFDLCIDQYRNGDQNLTEAFLMGGQVNGHDFHKALFNQQKMLIQ